MAKRSRATSFDTVAVGETQYAVCEDALLAILADGTLGPVVGYRDGNGEVTLDEEACAGEWVGELITARLPCGQPGGMGIGVDRQQAWSSAFIDSISSGRAAHWPGALDARSVARCREEIAQLDAEGSLQRGNHGQRNSSCIAMVNPMESAQP